jgi:hypothetical protein
MAVQYCLLHMLQPPKRAPLCFMLCEPALLMIVRCWLLLHTFNVILLVLVHCKDR